MAAQMSYSWGSTTTPKTCAACWQARKMVPESRCRGWDKQLVNQRSPRRCLGNWKAGWECQTKPDLRVQIRVIFALRSPHMKDSCLCFGTVAVHSSVSLDYAHFR